MRFHVLLAAVLALAACHHAKQATLPVGAQAPAAAATPPPKAPAGQAVSSNLAAGGDLIEACQLHFASTQQAPKFAFDAAELTAEDRDVLQQVAECVIRGPLKGHKLQLVGRADPRGTEEYNLGLGQRRAETVGTYLQHLGVSRPQIAVTTRGAIDATGRDDAGWQLDRRVDLKLD